MTMEDIGSHYLNNQYEEDALDKKITEYENETFYNLEDAEDKIK